MAKSLGGLTWKELSVRSWKRFHEHHILDQSAMLSFYFILSIFPLLLFLINVLGLLMQSGPATHKILNRYVTGVIPGPASQLIESNLSEIASHSKTVRFPLALLLSWLSGSQGVLAVIEGLNIAYGVRERRPLWKKYFTAFVLTIITLALIAAGLLLLTYGGYLSEIAMSFPGLNQLVGIIWPVTAWVIFVVFALTVFNLLYIYGPSVVHRQWPWMMPGTMVAVTIWLMVSLLFKLYLHYFTYYSVVYGSIGAVIVLMLWFYFFGIAILIGGVVNSEIEMAAGSAESSK